MSRSFEYVVSEQLLNQWQLAVDFLADTFNVASALIMAVQGDKIHVIISSSGDSNPYSQNEYFPTGRGLLCEAVMFSNQELHIPNTVLNMDWKDNPSIKRGLIAYLGLPIYDSNGILYGAVCIQDSKENYFDNSCRKYLSHLQANIIKDLNALHAAIEQAQQLETLQRKFEEEEKLKLEIEETLKDSQFFFQESQRAANIGSYRSDFVVDYWKTSQVCDEIFGIDDSYDKSIKGWSELVHPDDFESMISYVREEVIGRNQTFNREYRIIRKSDGVERWVLGLGETISNDQGECIGLIGTIQDITKRKQIELDLFSERALMNTLFDTIPDVIWLKDINGVYLRCNYRFEQFYGTSQEEIVGKTDYDFIAKELADSYRIHDQLAIERNGPVISESQSVFVSDGHIESLETTKVPMRSSKGDLIGVLGISHDITDIKKANEQLKLAAGVFTHAREGILITDNLSNVIEVNETFCNITGYSSSEVIGRNPRFLQSGRQPKAFYESMWKSLLKEHYWSGELWNRRKNGEVFAEMITISAITDSDNLVTNYIALFSDITSIKEHQQQLEHIAHYDALTDLPNRVLLAERLQQAMIQSDRDQESIAVAYLDIDAFKVVNDTYGHSVGDELLVEISKRMRATLGERDVLARIGGDEFIAVLTNIGTVAQCEQKLTNLLEAAQQTSIFKDSVITTTMSIGVTIYPQDESDADRLIRHADQAMYTAKQSGKNRFHIFDTHQNSFVQNELNKLREIKEALRLNEFVLYYQPKVDMRTGAAIGCEALIRWQHPKRGLLMPGEFLDITEKHQVGIEIGEWVIDSALSQIRKWQSIGINLPISVNISAQQLQGNLFAAKLSEALAKHSDVSPSLLELEILETSALEDMREALSNIESCLKMGVQFSLDDFGTGYSSLSYLKNLPAYLLKIDQSFVRDMLDDPDDEVIVEAVIGLSNAFKREVIAEGVETTAHGFRLLSMGCELAQGYGISKPIPAQKIPDWLQNWKAPSQWLESSLGVVCHG